MPRIARSRTFPAWVAAGFCAVGCGVSQPTSSPSSPVPYLEDTSFRRAEMLASMTNPSDGYAELREAHYATLDANDWDNLPEWNPATLPFLSADLGADGSAMAVTPGAKPLELSLSPTSEDDPALIELGRLAFRSYPVQQASYLGVAVASPQAPARYGLWVDDTRGVGGLVRTQMADGSVALSLTCSSCHASRLGGELTDGVPNASLNLGDAMLDSATGSIEPAVASAIAAWGPGRLDVTTEAGTEPARIPDLRPVAWLGYLQQDATVRQLDLTSLAIRIETLIITSQDELVRPPRLVALALAAYVKSLSGQLPPAEDETATSKGAEIFMSQCTGCHVPPSLTGTPVPLAVIGTDPTLGLSLERGTGTYRVPSLHGVGTRGPLLHDGTVPSVAAMFDPARPTPAYTSRLHGAGAVPGHAFGLDLKDADRAALTAYVSQL
jgi:hypothetical protein